MADCKEARSFYSERGINMGHKKRKSLSKKTRFEVFKRDGFQCAYCGQSPPSVVLEVDHIEPVSKGGCDDLSNLITSCFYCNRGKTDVPLSKIPSKLIDNIEVLKEKEDQLKEYRKLISAIKRREKRDIEIVTKIFKNKFTGHTLTDNFKNGSLLKFLKKLPRHEVEDSMNTACSRIQDMDDAIKYFCGICWNKIKNGYENE